MVDSCVSEKKHYLPTGDKQEKYILFGAHQDKFGNCINFGLIQRPRGHNWKEAQQGRQQGSVSTANPVR